MSSGYSSKRYRANLIDPYARTVERNLRNLLADKKSKDMIKNLKKYGKSYSYNPYLLTIARSTLDVRTFIKFMLASGVQEFNLNITDEELVKINEFEVQKALSDAVKN
ncbi:MAG: hypothetical protein WC656_01175 [Sulfurimonas sp.]|jgi:hypothetical protein